MTKPSDPPQQPPPPAAWYQDLSDPALLRYWDGTRWTAQTARRSTEADREVLAQPDPCGGAVSTQPASDSPVGIESLAPHKGWYPDPIGQHFARWWDGDTWTNRLTNRDGFAYKEPPPLKTQGPLGGREVIADYPLVGPPAAAKQIGIIIRKPPVRSSVTPARSDNEKSTGSILLAIILGLVVLGALVGATSSPDSTTGGSDSDEYDYEARPTSALLGEPVLSNHPPAVVPSNATPDDSLSSSNFTTYFMPEGVGQTEALSWYERYMPAGEDFRGLTWLEALPADALFGGPDHYWCSGPAESLDVAFGQNEPDDGGLAYVIIAVQTVSDGACG